MGNYLMDARRKILLDTPHTESATGEIATFETEMKAPLKECKVSFEPIQEGSGDPSPDNVRPIIGYNRIRLRKAGKNICEQYGWSARVASNIFTLYDNNTHGTSLSSTSGDSVIVTQSTYNSEIETSSYRNGYLCYVSNDLELGKTYIVTFDVTNITSNPLGVSLNEIKIYSPRGSVYLSSVFGSRLRFKYTHSPYASNPANNSVSIEIRICGMSCTISNFMVAPAYELDRTYEEYMGEDFILESPLPGKNLADIIGFSTSSFSKGERTTRYTSGSYGTTISTSEFSAPDTSVVITQSSYTTDVAMSSYRNGHVVVGIRGVKFGTRYRIGFRVTNIVSNPLNASLTDLTLFGPSSSGSALPYTIIDDRVVFEILYKQNTSNTLTIGFDVRICGMSFTMSEFMITAADEEDQSYEPYIKTMYGGYFNLTKGEFVAEWVGRTLRLSDNSYKGIVDAMTGYSFYGIFPEQVIRSSTTTMCSIAPLIYEEGSLQSAHFYTSTDPSTGKTNLMMYVDTDVDESTTFTVVGKLVESIHYSIPQQIIRSKLGKNNILTDIHSEIATKHWTHINAKYQTVIWNQYIRDLTSTYWKPQDSNYASVYFRGGVATITQTATPNAQYQTSMISRYELYWDSTHKYYFKQELKPSTQRYFRLIYRSAWGAVGVLDANTWSTLEGIYSPNDTTQNPFYVAYCTSGYASGDTCIVRNVIFVDLTQMFGAGNEPETVSEFRRICVKNRLDLDSYQPFDTGSQQLWAL